MRLVRGIEIVAFLVRVQYITNATMSINCSMYYFNIGVLQSYYIITLNNGTAHHVGLYLYAQRLYYYEKNNICIHKNAGCIAYIP